MQMMLSGIAHEVRNPLGGMELFCGLLAEDLRAVDTAENTEALEKVELFLDQTFLKNRAGVHIIHGHGTGALKRAVRGYLVDSPYVDDFRPGDKGEGGDGVTVAVLAERIQR